MSEHQRSRFKPQCHHTPELSRAGGEPGGGLLRETSQTKCTMKENCEYHTTDSAEGQHLTPSNSLVPERIGRLQLLR